MFGYTAFDYRTTTHHRSDFRVGLDLFDFASDHFSFGEALIIHQFVVLVDQGLDLSIFLTSGGIFKADAVFDLLVALIEFDRGTVGFHPPFDVVDHAVDHRQHLLAIGSIDIGLRYASA